MVWRDFLSQKQLCLFKNTRSECFQVVHAEVVFADQGLGRDDIGHHILVQRVYDRSVRSLGDCHGHDGLVHEFSGRQTVADVGKSAGRANPRIGDDNLFDDVDELNPEVVVHRQRLHCRPPFGACPHRSYTGRSPPGLCRR